MSKNPYPGDENFVATVIFASIVTLAANLGSLVFSIPVSFEFLGLVFLLSWVFSAVSISQYEDESDD